MKTPWVVGVLIVISGLGCSRSLSRDSAKTVIQKSGDFAPQKALFEVTREQLQNGVNKGLWRWDDISVAYVSVSPSTQKVLQFEGEQFGDKLYGVHPYPGNGRWTILSSGHSGYRVTTLEPIPRQVVEVTGITDGPAGQNGTARLVEFTWQWDLQSLPNDIRGVLPNQKKTQTIVLQLFDDGWRVGPLSPPS